MPDSLAMLKRVAIKIAESKILLPEYPPEHDEDIHPFDQRNIHPEIYNASKALFDDGHYKQASLEAYILIDNVVKALSNNTETGRKLMMDAFNGNNPKIKLNTLSNESEENEQEGYKFIFAGSAVGIRNPRAHETGWPETLDECLDHLALASLLMRKLDQSSK